MEVAHQLDQIDVPITEDGVVAPLKQMPALVVPAIVILGVGELQGLHGSGQRDRPPFDQEMHMIGHEDVGIAGQAIPLLVATEPLQVGGIIRCVMKEHSPAITPGNHMIQRPLDIYSGLASHTRECRWGLCDKSILMPDPVFDQETQLN